MARTIKPADVDKDTTHGEDIDYLEYGIQLPNGIIWWSTGVPPAPHLRGVEFSRLNHRFQQDKAQKAYADWIWKQGVAYDEELHRLRFVSRRQQIRYTDPEHLDGIELAEFQATSEER